MRLTLLLLTFLPEPLASGGTQLEEVADATVRRGKRRKKFGVQRAVERGNRHHGFVNRPGTEITSSVILGSTRSVSDFILISCAARTRQRLRAGRRKQQ